MNLHGHFSPAFCFVFFSFDFVMLLHQCKCWPCKCTNELIFLSSKYVEIVQWKLNRSIKLLVSLTSEWSFCEKIQLKNKWSIRCLQMCYAVRFEFRFIIDMHVQYSMFKCCKLMSKCCTSFYHIHTHTHIHFVIVVNANCRWKVNSIHKEKYQNWFCYHSINWWNWCLFLKKENSLLSQCLQWSTLLYAEWVSCVVYDFIKLYVHCMSHKLKMIQRCKANDKKNAVARGINHLARLSVQEIIHIAKFLFWFEISNIHKNPQTIIAYSTHFLFRRTFRILFRFIDIYKHKWMDGRMRTVRVNRNRIKWK